MTSMMKLETHVCSYETHDDEDSDKMVITKVDNLEPIWYMMTQYVIVVNVKYYV